MTSFDLMLRVTKRLKEVDKHAYMNDDGMFTNLNHEYVLAVMKQEIDKEEDNYTDIILPEPIITDEDNNWKISEE